VTPWPDAAKPDQGTSILGTWVTIKPGTFWMGSPASEKCSDSDEARHKVTLTRKVQVMAHEVTQKQFYDLMAYQPYYFPSCGKDCPAEEVSWHEAVAYCNALSSKNSLKTCYSCSGGGVSVSCKAAAAYAGGNIYDCPGYRLPTEAEWEYVYRAGTSTAYYSGAEDVAGCYSCTTVDANAHKIGWYCYNTYFYNKTKPVGKKAPNKWGLYDMAGNVWEWCHDAYQSNLGTTAVKDPVITTGSKRILRGGAWNNFSRMMRAANRMGYDPSKRDKDIGFRCVRTTK